MGKILEKRTARHFNAGDIIFKEGDPGSSMYVITVGTVEVSKLINNQKVVLAKLDKGSVFGEMALIDNQDRSATVKALTEVDSFEINQILFNELLQEVPSWMRAFYQILVERLREANKKQNTLGPREQAKQVVFLLATMLENEYAEERIQTIVPWQKTVETISFLTNITYDRVNRVMEQICMTPLAKSQVDYRLGRIFVSDNLTQLQRFAEYCKHIYLHNLGLKTDPNLEEKSPDDFLFLDFISSLLNEQAKAPDLNLQYLRSQCENRLKRSMYDFSAVIRDLLTKGVLTARVDQNNDKYYHVDLKAFEKMTYKAETLEFFKSLEAKLG